MLARLFEDLHHELAVEGVLLKGNSLVLRTLAINVLLAELQERSSEAAYWRAKHAHLAKAKKRTLTRYHEEKDNLSRLRVRTTA